MTTVRDLTKAVSLAANRHGVITEAQRRAAAQLTFGSTGVELVLLVLVSAAVAYILASSERPVWLAFAVVAVPLCLASAFVLWRITQAYVRRLDLNDGVVRSTVGAVNWRLYRYVAEFPEAPWGDNVTGQRLIPGPYRFYYLPRSRYVLSAQPLRPAPTAAPPTMANDELQRLLKVTPYDIAHNRAGRLSPSQRDRFQTEMLSRLAIFGVIATLAIAKVIDHGWSGLDPSEVALLVLEGLTLVIFGFGAGRKLLLGEVRQAQGRAELSDLGGLLAYRYRLRIGPEEFRLWPNVYNVLKSGHDYRVYYTARGREVLAIESFGASGDGASSQGQPR